VVFAQEIVDPGRGLAQFVVAGRHDGVADGVFAVLCFEALIGADPDALFFIGVDFAPTFEAAAARGVALVLGALRNGTQIGHIE